MQHLSNLWNAGCQGAAKAFAKRGMSKEWLLGKAVKAMLPSEDETSKLAGEFVAAAIENSGVSSQEASENKPRNWKKTFDKVAEGCAGVMLRRLARAVLGELKTSKTSEAQKANDAAKKVFSKIESEIKEVPVIGKFLVTVGRVIGRGLTLFAASLLEELGCALKKKEEKKPEQASKGFDFLKTLSSLRERMWNVMAS